jgi:hypothetical protein
VRKSPQAGEHSWYIGLARPKAAVLLNNTSVIVERIIDRATTPWRMEQDALTRLWEKAVKAEERPNQPVRPAAGLLVMHLQQLLIHS